MREVDEIHDPEHQRQAGRQQEQQQSELQPVQALFYEQKHGAFADDDRCGLRRLYLISPEQRLFHRALAVECILVVRDDGGDSLEHERAVGALTTS